VLASLVVDGIVPSVSISKNNIVTSVVTNTNTDTYKPIIQTDMIISATISGLYTSGLAPILNASNYQQIIKYMLYINRKLEFDLDIKQMLEFNSDIRRKLDFNSDIKSSTNSALKI
jgi:hypothetical protein